MTASVPAVRPGSPWREARRRFSALWRRSLQFRTVAITIGLSTLAVLVIGLYMTFTVASSLFQTQLERVLGASNSATVAAQKILTSTDASDRAALQTVMGQVSTTVQQVTGSSAAGWSDP